MTHKFNGSNACYLCDYCSTILWIGRDKPKNLENVISVIGKKRIMHFCNNKCEDKQLGKKI
jgi:ribosomal protein L24E